MESTNEPPRLCEICETQAAAKKFVYPKREEMVCEQCFEQYGLQHDLDMVLLTRVSKLESSRRYDEALSSLQEFLEANSHRDQNGWLARSIARDRMMILLDADRHEEALKAGQDWQQVGFEDVSQRWMHATASGKALEALGRDAEAVPIIEDALSYQEEKYLPGALSILSELVRFSEKLGMAVHLKWLTVAQALADYEGVEMPTDPSPPAAIRALQARILARSPEERRKRYQERAIARHNT